VEDQAQPIAFKGTGKWFRSKGQPVEAVRSVSFSVAPNEFVSIVGPSGCGKSTLLRLMAGLSYPTSGAVVCNGVPVQSINTEVGFVTQESNLFPWMSLVENVEFPLLAKGVPRRERRERALELIEIVGLRGFEERYPYELSGGMQKRASIIRTIIYGPKIVLMDEPFGPLDAQTRLILQSELLRIWSRNLMTILFVTHDLVEAIALSDRIVVMSSRPGTTKRILDVPLERPRDVFEIHRQQGYTETYHQLWELMRSELQVSA
jgi:NitT/TauT family transport system ATP-binding protein